MSDYKTLKSVANIVDTGTQGTKIATGDTAQRGSTAGQVRFNNQTGNIEYYDGSRFKILDAPPLVSSTNPSTIISHINNYNNTSTFKTVLTRSTAYGTSSSCVDAFIGTWRNTAAITSITVASSSANFTTASTFSLYGIASA